MSTKQACQIVKLAAGLVTSAVSSQKIVCQYVVIDFTHTKWERVPFAETSAQSSTQSRYIVTIQASQIEVDLHSDLIL